MLTDIDTQLTSTMNTEQAMINSIVDDVRSNVCSELSELTEVISTAVFERVNARMNEFENNHKDYMRCLDLYACEVEQMRTCVDKLKLGQAYTLQCIESSNDTLSTMHDHFSQQLDQQMERMDEDSWVSPRVAKLTTEVNELKAEVYSLRNALLVLAVAMLVAIVVSM